MTNQTKKAARFSILLLTAFMMISSVLWIHTGTLAIAAETETNTGTGTAVEATTTYANNVALLAEKFGELNDIKSTNITTTVGSEANTYVDQYVFKLNEIGKNEALLGEESTADLIELYYTQGLAANQIAWIYYTYINRLEGEAKAAVDQVHNGVHNGTEEIGGLQDEIANAKNAEDLAELLTLTYNNNGLCARMYVSVFEQRLLALLEENDSDAVKEIVTGENGAIKAIAKCTVVTSSEQYDAIYEKATQDVLVRRNKDKASAELTKIFAILYPDASYAENQTVTAALQAIDSAEVTLASQMNAAVKNAVETLLAEISKDAGSYVVGYTAKLYENTATAVAVADGESQVAALSPLFENYALDLARAKAKDSITANIAERDYKDDREMTELADEYNSEGGIIDGCMTEAEIEFELGRADLRVSLYGEYLTAVKTIEGWIEDADLLSKAYDQYDYAKYRIAKADRSEAEAAENCQNEYDKGLAALKELIVEAEVRAYEPKHREILDKEVNEITVQDKEALIAAIRDMADLSDGAQAVFEEKKTPDDLANKYKAVAKQEIEAAIGSSSDIRKDNAYELKDKLDDLYASDKADNLEKLISDADAIVAKAEGIDQVIDRYEQILASEEYESFSNADQAKLEDLIQSATKELNDSDVRGEQFAGAVHEAIAGLNRAEAYARIDAYVSEQSGMTDTTQAAVNKLVTDAKAAIDKQSDATVIQKLTDAVIFDVKQESDIQKLTEEAEKAIDSIHSMDVLSDTQKEAHEEKIRNYLSEQSDKIRKASDETSHQDATNAFERQLSKLLNDAQVENETERANRRAEASEALRDSHEKSVADIDQMAYLTEEERTVLKQAADLALSKGLTTINSAHSPAAITAAMNDAISVLDWTTSEGYSQNEAAGTSQRSEASDKIRTKARALITKIDDKRYLSDDEKTSLKQEVENTVIEFSGDLTTVSGTENLDNVKQAASEQLDQISETCDARDLEGAKQAAVNEINAQRDEIAKDIDQFRFLGAERCVELRQAPELTAAEAENAIMACDSTDDVITEKEKALSDLNAQAAEARQEENQACVEALTPFITAFAIAFAAEAVALLALWLIYRKKSAVTACIVPVFALALMPTPLAWTLTVLLSVSDIAMAVLIVYLIIKICKLKASEPVEIPEPEIESSIEIEIEVEPDEESDECGLQAVEVSDTMPVAREPKKAKPSRPRLTARPALARLFAPMNKPRLEPKPQLIYLLPPAIPKLVAAITAEEADQLISDQDAFHCEETNLVNTEVYTGKKKAVVNIDLIGRSFSAGEMVSLNTLKEKGLISPKVGHVKILGKGTLDKPLTVVAQNFSASAVKMIVLTGGTAILAEGSPERRRR